MRPNSTPSESSRSRREVNSLLHTLRGEHFRHTQNLKGSQEHVSNAVRRRIGPSLPYDVIFGTLGQESSPSTPTGSNPDVPSLVAGPVPRSWAQQRDAGDIHLSVEGRQEALSLVFAHSGTSPDPEQTTNQSRVPTLVNLCLHLLLEYCGSGKELVEDVVPHLSHHLRRELLRLTAVHCPLPNATLYSLFEPEGHADGEIIVVGPQASLRSDTFRPPAKEQAPPSPSLPPTSRVNKHPPWDSVAVDDEWSAPGPPPVYSIILLSTALSVPTLLTLPPSLTHLALLHLPSAIPVHRLPGKCPQLEVLDLSYNSWLGTTYWGEQELLDLVVWSRWRDLKVFGCRRCEVKAEALRRVNEGRCTDVEIVS